MAEDILVRESLTKEMIEAGAKLLERLDADHYRIVSAFWLFDPEEDPLKWRLIIASPLVTSEGPRKFYERILDANLKADADEPVVSLNDVEVIGADKKLVGLIRNSISVDSDSESGVRLSRCSFDAMFIEDAYVYKV